jgi:hypothetical protein
MTQVAVIDIIGPVAQFCPSCPTTTLVQAYIDAARKLCNKSRWLKATIPGSTTAPVVTPYTTGTVTVTNGSATVTGAGTAWLANVTNPDTFTGPNGVVYTVLSVASDTSLTLAVVYGGATLAGQAYSIGRSRTYPLYSLGSDTYNEILGIEAIAITATATDIHPLTPRVSSEWDSNDARDTPELYEYVPHGQFAVHPTPDAAYALTVSVILQPKRGSNSLDDTLLVSWDYALQDGALAYLLKLPGMPWIDKTEATVREGRFQDAIHQAASDAQASYNAGALGSSINGVRGSMMRTKQQGI